MMAFTRKERAWISRGLRAIMNDLAMYMDGREVSVDIAEGYKWRLESMLGKVVDIKNVTRCRGCYMYLLFDRR